MILLTTAAMAGSTDLLLAIPAARTRPMVLSLPTEEHFSSETRPAFSVPLGARLVHSLSDRPEGTLTVQAGIDGWAASWHNTAAPMRASMWTVPVEVGFRVGPGALHQYFPPPEPVERDRSVYLTGGAGPSITAVSPSWWEGYIGVGAGAHLGLGGWFPVAEQRVIIEARGTGQLYLSGYSGVLLLPEGQMSFRYYPGHAALTVLAGIQL